MNHRFGFGRAPGDPKRWALVGLGIVILGGLAWVYGSRFWAMAELSAEVNGLRVVEEDLHQEIVRLEQRLYVADAPSVVEEEARRVLHWGFPGEERIILIWR